MITSYLWFRDSSIVILLIHFLGLLPLWVRYAGKLLDPTGLLKYELILWPSYILSVLSYSIALVYPETWWCLVPGTVLLRYIHIDRRYKSLARGAGAVGIIPYSVSVTLLLIDFYLQNVQNSSRYVTTVMSGFSIYWGAVLINSGINKLRSGYLSGIGIQSFLSNPHWSRFWRYFHLNPISLSSRKFLGFSAVLIELTSGVLLISLKAAPAGAIIMIILFVTIGIFLKLYTLPWISVLSGYGIFLYFSEDINYKLSLTHIFYNANTNWETVLLLIYFLAFPLSAIFALFYYTINENYQNRATKFLRMIQKIPIVNFQVFTRPIIETLVFIIPKNQNIDISNLQNLTLLSKNTVNSYSSVTEAVILTSIVNTLKSEQYYDKFFPRLKLFKDSLDKKMTEVEIQVYFYSESDGKGEWEFIFSICLDKMEVLNINKVNLKNSNVSTYGKKMLLDKFTNLN
jgi:hypothetical protein